MAQIEIEELHNAIRSLSGRLLVYGVVAFVVLAVLYIVWEVMHRRRRKPITREPDLTIDVPALGVAGPPAGAPQLEFYNLPVRLVAIVLAPVGRGRQLPPASQIHGVIDSIVPGLADVAVTHESLLYYWPTQLSPRGFAHAFFKHARLPGDGGKDTPWCSVAGTFKVRSRPVMAGLIMSADSSNSLSQMIIESESKWLDVLRIKRPQ